MNKIYMNEKTNKPSGDTSDCGCKGKTADSILKETTKNKNAGFTNGIFRGLVFSIFLILVPIIMLYFIWVAFKMIILNKNVDIKKALLAITKGKTEYVDDDDYDELVMTDVEDISEQYRK